jgi:hypothetical protein
MGQDGLGVNNDSESVYEDVTEKDHYYEREDSSRSDRQRWGQINRLLESDTDKAKLAGLSLGGIWGAQRFTEGEDLADRAPESIEIAGIEADISSQLEKLNQFYSESVHGLGREADTFWEKFTLQADKIGHYTVSYLGASIGCKIANSFSEDYDPKRVVIGGMAMVPLYFGSKEILYEGRELEDIIHHADVRGDLIADTAGAAHAVYNYHKRKTVEEGEEPEGLLEEAANAAGKAYQKGLNRIQSIG